jgi:hypothetical protein
MNFSNKLKALCSETRPNAKPETVIGHFKTDTVLTTNSEHYDRNKNALQSHSTDSQTIG